MKQIRVIAESKNKLVLDEAAEKGVPVLATRPTATPDISSGARTTR